MLLTILLIVAGCDKETIGPQTEGAIAGEVQDARTNAPISTANVTTSPPTQSVITDGEGRFVFGGVPPGNYTVEATKVDYKARSVQVKVRNEDTTSATILLERTEEFGPRSDSLVALVTNWYNDRVNRDSTGQDSLFADVEYRVRNVGGERIRRYEVYFEIDTPDGLFSREGTGDSLAVDQQDVGGFRKYVTAEATAVRIEDVYWTTGSD